MMNKKKENAKIGRIRHVLRSFIAHRSLFIISSPAVCFLLHFPEPCGRWALPTTLSCGVRTFLPSRRTTTTGERPSRSESVLSLLSSKGVAQPGRSL